jgi:hypothetical protein
LMFYRWMENSNNRCNIPVRIFSTKAYYNLFSVASSASHIPRQDRLSYRLELAWR